jgi:hypothetical protein
MVPGRSWIFFECIYNLSMTMPDQLDSLGRVAWGEFCVPGAAPKSLSRQLGGNLCG